MMSFLKTECRAVAKMISTLATSFSGRHNILFIIGGTN